MSMAIRNCPICGGKGQDDLVFPYSTRYSGYLFLYHPCAECRTSYVNPVPDEATFQRMYAKSSYHDAYYEGQSNNAAYQLSASRLKKYLPEGSFVLDYGCGLGWFLMAAKSLGYGVFGVEFDREAAKEAAEHLSSTVLSTEEFRSSQALPMFDAIHLGDVLEHLPEPAETLKELLKFLKPDGILFVEGPLENNPSPVFWAASLYGKIKRLLFARKAADFPPTHLFRVNAEQQLHFFYRVDKNLTKLEWEITETGWPYNQGGGIKRFIAQIARWLGGRRYGSVTLGNRFHGMFRYQGE